MTPSDCSGSLGRYSTVQQILSRLDLGEDKSKKPDLTLDQLMTLAILSSETGRLTLCSINHWFCTNFRWYANQHKSCHAKPRTSQPGWYDYAQPCGCEIALARRLENTFAAPVKLFGLLSPFRYYPQDRTVSIIPGWSERVLSPESIEDPEFHLYSKLPTEIRIEILRQAFSYNLDENGWKIQEALWGRSRPRTLAATVDGRGVGHIHQQSLLSPLLVNRQMHEESAMLLFTQNNFHFDNCWVMASFLQRIGAKNRGWMTSVSLDYMIPGNVTFDRSRAHRAFRLLAEAKRLRSLRINMDETNITRNSEPLSVQSFPGFRILKNLRGLRNVVFEGAYERSEAYLKAGLMTPFKRCTGERIKSKAQLEAEKVKRLERARSVRVKEAELRELRREAQELQEQIEVWGSAEIDKEQPRRRRLHRKKAVSEEGMTSADEDDSISIGVHSIFDEDEEEEEEGTIDDEDDSSSTGVLSRFEDEEEVGTTPTAGEIISTTPSPLRLTLLQWGPFSTID